MNEILRVNTSTDESIPYALSSFVSCDRRKQEGGRYACYLKRSTAGWYLVSDDSVVSLATLCENDGCVLFYTRTGTPDAGRDC